MILDAFAAVGLWASLRQFARFVHWRLFVNRDGNSGRYGHWSIER